MNDSNGSASATERTLACPASLVLPRVRRERPGQKRGHGIHRYVSAVLSGVPVTRALELVDAEHWPLCKRVDWRELGADLVNVRSEVAYALDPVARTARMIGVDIGRQYGRLGPNEIPGSDDIEGELPDGTPVVIDMKSGFLDVTDAEENGQGLFFGAVKHLMTGASEVEFRIAKLLPSGRVVPDVARYTAFEIDSFLDEYEVALARKLEASRVYLAGGVPNVNVGPYCRYCEGFESCPGQVKLARAMVTDASELDARVASLTLAESGVAWRKAKQVESLLDRVLDALKARAGQEPLPLGDGKEVRATGYDKSSFDREAALGLLQDKGATKEEIASLYRPVHIEQVRELNVRGVKPARKRTKPEAA